MDFLDKTGGSEPIWTARPFQLVSLLKMLETYALSFYSIGESLKHVEATCQFSQGIPFGDKYTALIREDLESIELHCLDVGLTLSAKTVARMRAIKDKDFTPEKLGPMIVELQHRLEDELEQIKFKLTTPKQAEYYETNPLFGEGVSHAFSKTAFDVEEAGKCLALDRGTACVMHLMRVMEAAIDAIALGVGVPVTAVRAVGAWEQLLNMIRDKIQANNKAPAPPWLAAKPFYESAYAFLHAVKDAWRNPAIHAEQKYTPEEAERIYVAIKNLLSHLAEHLDETGTFTP